MKGRRRTVVLCLSGAMAALSLFAGLGAAGLTGRLSAEILPNPLSPIRDDSTPPPALDWPTPCAVLGDGTTSAPSDANCADPGLPTGPGPSDTTPSGIAPLGRDGGIPPFSE
jgi:hypothetical protein